MSMKLKKRVIIKWFSLILIIMAILLSSLACNGYFNIVIENKTTQVLTIYLYEHKVGNVDPGEQITVKSVPINAATFLIIAKNSQEETIFSRTFTRQQMQYTGKDTYDTYKVTIPPLEKEAQSGNATIAK